MIELTRRTESQDIISNLASISVSMEDIAAKRQVTPNELERIEITMDRLLALRQVISVKQQHQEKEEVQKACDLMFEVATEAIHRIRSLRLCGAQSAQDVEIMLGYYADAVTAALHMVSVTDRLLEPRFRVALQWTS